MTDVRTSTVAPAAGTPSDAALSLRAFAASSPRPLSIADLRLAGVAMPGQALYELELAGHRVTRVYGRDASQRRTMLGYRLD